MFDEPAVSHDHWELPTIAVLVGKHGVLVVFTQKLTFVISFYKLQI